MREYMRKRRKQTKDIDSKVQQQAAIIEEQAARIKDLETQLQSQFVDRTMVPKPMVDRTMVAKLMLDRTMVNSAVEREAQEREAQERLEWNRWDQHRRGREQAQLDRKEQYNFNPYPAYSMHSPGDNPRTLLDTFYNGIYH
jgi:hypothetical protein